MTATVGSISVPESGTKKLDTCTVSTTEGTVHREGVFLGDPETPGNRTMVNSGGSINAAPDRATAKAGRTYFTANKSEQNTDQTVYTPPSGKAYVTAIIFSGYNTSTLNAGHIDIKDDTAILIPISFPTAGVGATPGGVPISIAALSFPEPLQFSTNVKVDVVTGTITYSVAIVGYYE